MKIGFSKFILGGLMLAALPLLSACYATVGTDGRTYFQPIGYGFNSGYYSSGHTQNISASYGYSSMAPYVGYRAAQGYTSYAPRYSSYYTTVPATSTYTSYPVVSRSVVSQSSDVCLVAPKPTPAMSCR